MAGPFAAFVLRAGALRARWRRFAGASPLRRLGHATLVSAVASLGAKGVGFVREIVVASAFGLADGVDVYLVAFVVVGFPLSILLNAAQTALVATLASGRGDGREARAYGTTLVATLAVALVATPLWLVATDLAMPWIASGFDHAKRDALRHALWLLLPYTAFNAVNLLGYAVLQARHRFGVVGLLPGITPLVICLVVATHPIPGAWQLLATGLVAGTALECLALGAVLHHDGVRVDVDPRGTDFRHVAAATLALLPGTLFVALGPLAEQSIAAALGSGTNSALGYGNRIPAALSGVVVMAVGTTVLPHFASLLAAGDAASCLHSLRKLGRLLFATGLLGAAVLALASTPITTAVYQRGAFVAAATPRVAAVQAAYFLQLPFSLLAMLAMRTLSAARRNDTVSVLTALTVVVQVALAWTLGTRYGAAGIATAATLATAFSAAAAFTTASRTLAASAHGGTA
ncbi:MAG TPA: lipid II flippase MurJ [Burkholderiaceae bacterium]|nr:lipid II flippase MurJ [Burkholderiaceae bacterium]